jgi:hypothetical protein
VFGGGAEEDTGREAVDAATVRAGAATLYGRASGRLGSRRGYTHRTSTLVTLASSMVPLALVMVHTWTGLVGCWVTRTW